MCYDQVCVKQETLAQFPRYGDLYQGLCSTTGEIPIAIYRTQRRQRDVLVCLLLPAVRHFVALH